MSLLKDVTPVDGAYSAIQTLSLSIFRYQIAVGTEPSRRVRSGFLSSFLRDNDDPDDGFGTRPMDFSYEKFQQVAQEATGNKGASKWLAKISEQVFTVSQENEWHHVIHSALRFCLIDPNEFIGAGCITFTVDPVGGITDNKGSKRGPSDSPVQDTNHRSTKKPRNDNSQDVGQTPSNAHGALDNGGSVEDWTTSHELDWESGSDEIVLVDDEDDGNSSPIPPVDRVELVQRAIRGEGLYERDALDGISLDDVARYFGVTVDTLRRRNAFTLQGTKEPIRLDQTIFVYRYLRRCNAAAPQLRGQILADGTGLGKTRSAFALMAEMRWIAINAEHIQTHPDQHLTSESEETVCPSPRWRGSECACVKGSIRHRWAQRLMGGPFLAVVPSTIQHQWEFGAEDYFYKFIDDEGSGHDSNRAGYTDFISAYAWFDGNFHKATDDNPISGAELNEFKNTITGIGSVSSPRVEGSHEIMQGITGNEYRTLQLDERQHNHYQQRVRENLEVNIIPQSRSPSGRRGRTPSSNLVIISDSAIKNATSKPAKITMITLTTRIRDRPGVTIEVDLHFAIPPSLAVMDEAHIPAANLAIWQRLRYILSSTVHHPQRNTSWLFLSATLFNRGPSAWLHIIEYLYAETSRLEAERQRFTNCSLSYSTMNDSAVRQMSAHDAQNRISRLSRQMLQGMAHIVIARREGTPMGAGNRVVAYEGQVIHTPIPINLAGAALDAVERLGTAWRNRPTLNGKTVDGLLKVNNAFLPYYCATLMPGLAIAHEECMRLPGDRKYPFSLADILSDIAARDGRDSLVMARLRCHDDSPWLAVMMRVINRAFHDRGVDKSEPRKNVLIITAYSGIAEHLTRILRKSREMRTRVNFSCITSEKEPRERGKEIRRLKLRAAVENGKIEVVVSTAEIVGTGIDGLSFCNYLIIFGDLLKPEHFEQVRGRVARAGQLYDTRVYSLSVQHDVQELVRRSAQNPGTVLSRLGLFTSNTT